MWKELREKYPQLYECEVAYHILKDSYPEFADVIRPLGSLWKVKPTWEQLLVHYSDVRVFKEKIVGVGERLNYLKEQYPHHDQRWEYFEQFILEQEHKIFSLLPFASHELAKKITELNYGG